MAYKLSPYMSTEIAESLPCVYRVIKAGNVNEMLKSFQAALVEGGWTLEEEAQTAKAFSWLPLLWWSDTSIRDPLTPLNDPIRVALWVTRQDPAAAYAGGFNPEPDTSQELAIVCFYDEFKELPIAEEWRGTPIIWVPMGGSPEDSLSSLCDKLAQHFIIFSFGAGPVDGWAAPDYYPGATRAPGPWVLEVAQLSPGNPDGNDYQFSRSAGGSSNTTQGGWVCRSQEYRGKSIEIRAFRNRLGHATFQCTVTGGGGTFTSQLRPYLAQDGSEWGKYHVFVSPHQVIARAAFKAGGGETGTGLFTGDEPGINNTDPQALWTDSMGFIASNLWQPEEAEGETPAEAQVVFTRTGFRRKLYWDLWNQVSTGSLYRGHPSKSSIGGLMTLRHEQHPVKTWSEKPIIGNATVMLAEDALRESRILGKLWNCVTISDVLNPTGGDGLSFSNYDSRRFYEITRQLGSQTDRTPQAGLWIRTGE